MVNSVEVGCGQRVVWVAAHAARAGFGLSDFLWVIFSGDGDCASAIFILEKREVKICRGKTLFCSPWF
jgi:hypothetical protein